MAKLPICKFRKDNFGKQCFPDNFWNHTKCDKCPVWHRNERIILNDYVERMQTNIYNKDGSKNNYHLICDFVKEHGGHWVKIRHANEYGILICATTTLEDHYWVLLTDYNKLTFDTCVDWLDPISEDELPMSCSILKYMYDNQRKDLKEFFWNRIKEYKHDKIITKVYL